MFENIIAQSAVLQLGGDILSRRIAPSMLFYGPGESGKGSSALELSRVLSCEDAAAWKCACPSCDRHRYLLHDDLLILGNRNFSAEIAASCSAFLRNQTVISAKLLFFRSLRKLQIRFSPAVLEDDSKMIKLSSLLFSFDEKLNELLVYDPEASDKIPKDTLEKLCISLTEDALKLEKEGISANLPISHVRSASSWCRYAPNGKRKLLLIENAENMRGEACNALLKLLEEPPDDVCIVMTAKRREAIIPTIRSRLRQYRFLKRDAENEEKVIRLVFRDTIDMNKLKTKNSLITAYLESFAPQSTEKMYPLAAWFIVSMARIIAVCIKKTRVEIPAIISAIGERYAQTAETLNLERAVKSDTVIKIILAQTGNFEDDSFSRFMKLCVDMIGEVTIRSNESRYIAYNDLFKKYITEAVTAVDVLYIKESTALEALFYNIKKAVKEGRNG